MFYNDIAIGVFIGVIYTLFTLFLFAVSSREKRPDSKRRETKTPIPQPRIVDKK